MEINNRPNSWNEHWFQFILRNPDKPWDWEYLSSNPNLTMEFVEKYQDKHWDWDLICANKMGTMKRDFIHKSIRQQQFMDTNFEPLIMTVFHPKNIHKFGDLVFLDET